MPLTHARGRKHPRNPGAVDPGIEGIINPLDVYTKVLLHMDAADASTSFIDESGKVWTVSGNAQIDTATYRFGGSAGLFDGTGDYIQTGDSDDFHLSNVDWTFDFWIKINSAAATINLFSQYVDANNWLDAWISTGGTKISFESVAGGVAEVNLEVTYTFATGVWYHVAIVRSGNTPYFFVNGVSQTVNQLVTISGKTLTNFAAPFVIGAYNAGGSYNGWLDEFHFSKGIARWTANFIPQGYPYYGSNLVPDSQTKALLHFNNVDGSIDIFDEVGNVWYPSGNAQIDTAQKKFGTASLLLDGTGDYITSAADNDNWQLDGGSNSNAWTIDFWVRFNGDPGTGTQGFITQSVDNNNNWRFVLASNTVYFQIYSASVNTVSVSFAWDPAGNTWYHVALVKNGTSGYMMFVDGVQVGTTQTDTDVMPNFAAPISVGTVAGGNYLNGWIDELRISKGIARWTANFTPPSAEY